MISKRTNSVSTQRAEVGFIYVARGQSQVYPDNAPMHLRLRATLKFTPNGYWIVISQDIDGT